MTALYIVFEGIDGSGKTTQAARLVERFKASKYDTRKWVEPTMAGEVGIVIRRRLADGPPLEPWEALGLFAADRRDKLDELKLNIERGAVVVQDRSYFSTAVYQGDTERGGFKSPSWRFIVNVHEEWMPRPDLLILLDLDAAEASRRIAARGRPTSFEVTETLTRYRERYRRILADAEGEALVILDASLPADALEEAVWNLAVRRLTQKKAELASRDA